jgi:hypothetical protein
MTGKQQRNGTRRAAPVLTWVLLTAATVAALTVGHAHCGCRTARPRC